MKKTLEAWERETGVFARDLRKWGSKTMDREEFDAIVRSNLNEFTGVNYEQRVKFLKDNGYELTRENLMDGELSVKPVEE